MREEEEGREVEESMFMVKLLNIQGLTNEKYGEIHYEVEDYTLICLTETQKKIDNIRVEENIKVISSMRRMDEKKGGGLMLLYREREDFYFEKRENRKNDIMQVKGKIGKRNIVIWLVYLATGNDLATKEENNCLMREIEETMEKESGESRMILGDFNGHLGYLGHQEENQNGKVINDFLERNDVVLLNIDERCEGVYSWERGDHKSAIDLVMVNDTLYRSFKRMEVDEERNRSDISDHCWISTWWSLATQKRKQEGWIEKKYYSLTEEN